MDVRVPLSELKSRLINFRFKMEVTNPGWDMAVIFGKVNLYYFTGTMQDGMLIIPRNNDATLWVKRSFERAVLESNFPSIKPMNSYRDAVADYDALPDTVYIETEIVPCAMIERFQKHFPFKITRACDGVIASIRAIKSKYELDLMVQSGRIHQHVLEEILPTLLKEGMSELDLSLKLYEAFVHQGHHGVARFAMFEAEVGIGHVAFGTNSLYPTSFNGPGGHLGMSPATPFNGNRNQKLKKGDLIFIDVACGVGGYHTDKSMTYVFGAKPTAETIAAHQKCLELERRIAEMLKPGAIPSQIYSSVMESLPGDFKENFMGFGKRQASFLGHGIGLTIDEYPVLAKGFDEPIKERMAFAVEPKKGVENVGLVGIENTYIVDSQGSYCITGKHPGLLYVE